MLTIAPFIYAFAKKVYNKIESAKFWFPKQLETKKEEEIVKTKHAIIKIRIIILNVEEK